jgi:hypothetical protein
VSPGRSAAGKINFCISACISISALPSDFCLASISALPKMRGILRALILLLSVSAKCVGYTISSAVMEFASQPRFQKVSMLRYNHFSLGHSVFGGGVSKMDLRGSPRRNTLAKFRMTASSTGTTMLEDGSSVTGTEEQRQRTKVWNVIEVWE